jgi:hypothetical protein
MVYDITDTFVYFVKAQNGKTYKMTFKSFAGGAQGKSTFNFYEATTGIRETEAGNTFSIYPNPGTSLVSVESDLDVKHMEMLDMQGKVVYSGRGVGAIDISNLSNGLYIIKLHTNAGVYHQQMIKQ